MNQSTSVRDSHGQETSWGPEQAIELWKYFGTVGAADKNTMVTAESLLLGFSAAIIWYLGTQLICFQPLSIARPFQAIYLAVLGLVIAGLAAYVAMLYGGYSNWNWARADAIALEQSKQDPKWKELLPKGAKIMLEERDRSWHCAIASRLSQPCSATQELPPIFGVYAWLAVGSVMLYLVVLVLAVRGL
jgi:hypothetical protein